jgi:dihydrofolate reductase
MSISLIVAVANNGVIGKANDLPWRLSTDLKRFKTLTTGHTVVMGRKTFESIVARLGKPLPNRTSIVVSTRADFSPTGCQVVNDFNAWAKNAVPASEEFFVIGGASIYETALPYASKLYITHVETNVDGDAFFPAFNRGDWKCIHEERVPRDTVNDFDTLFCIYERK